MARKALGKGIDALIPASTVEDRGSTVTIPVALIAENPYQPRKVTGQEVQDLASSIKEHGLLQPIVVRRHGAGYQLVAGSRRLKASQLAGLNEVPVIIREADDRQMLALALVENLQRENLNPIESALAYKELSEAFGMTQEDISRVVGKDRSTIANTLRLLSLPRKARLYLEEEKISEGHARALLQIASLSLVEKICDRILNEGLTVRAVEKIAQASKKITMPSRRKQLDGIHASTEELISERLGVKVKLVRTSKGGKIELLFSNESELDRLVDWFKTR